ncbi:MAG: glutamine-hydrolyzing carbamoyl-phosphate synthase small subunit [Clostridia bacterium]|nr:glutamine-hydrolyzing carbamoyl-phosphate synthase small subunit [Clostridia bacterium]
MELMRKAVLENGMEFVGTGFGAHKDSINELVFCTGVVGYQEVLTDPACAGLTMLMTYPWIGNYGITNEDDESRSPVLGGLIVREYNDTPSNFRYTKTLSEALEENGIPGLSGVDTRQLTRIIRTEGSQKVLITDAATPHEEAMQRLCAYTAPTDLIASVSCRKRWYSRTSNPRFNVVAIDCGLKMTVIQTLNRFGCNVTVVPYNTSAEDILAAKPDGVFISNGPGSPQAAVAVIDTVAALIGKMPLFGVGLGFQILCCACGAKTYKTAFAYSSGNHPVKNLLTNKIEIVSQSHHFGIDAASLANTCLSVTHIDLLTKDVEGAACPEKKVFGVQFHPEGAPGPQDSTYLYEQFIGMMA